MNNRLPFVIIVLALVVIGLFNSLYIVKEWETGLKTYLGRVTENNIGPGLHFKLPIVENVYVYDTRIQTLATRPERFLTLEKKNLIVDTFMEWEIEDPQVFYERFKANPALFDSLITPILMNNFRAEFGKRDLQEVVAGVEAETNQTVRSVIQSKIIEIVQEEASEVGVKIVDVRIKGVELPSDVLESVFARMRTERERAAKEFRARGEAQYVEKIAMADRERLVKLANAYTEAQKIRGQGDAKAAELYAEAYSKNAKFFDFYKSLDAYKASIKSEGDILILDTDSEFFKYFQAK